MKILIGYDGSECAAAALEDLKNAGLPKATEALVISVADVFLPPPIDEEVDNAFPLQVPTAVRLAHERAARELKEADSLAEQASKRLKAIFPEWRIDHGAMAESPAWALIWRASEWKADLVVVGAEGHSLLGGRLILGSVSQRVAHESTCSVRIARGGQRDSKLPLKLVIGVDGSVDSATAVSAVCQREWPKGTQAHLVVAVDTVIAVAPDPTTPSVRKWMEVGPAEQWDQLRQVFAPLTAKLSAAGLSADVIVRKGNPKDELVDEAKSWGADCIFVGAHGLRGVERLLLGSVSSAVSARAHCSVEIVRSKTTRSPT
ncbi:MAG TPA: universal stress protein [Pyrinomonadaceae bacterium]|nr:universal stress protein [Pyrinomonadaceae bacterium]